MFGERYEDWLKRQQQQMDGEALRRLIEGHAHAEKLFVEQVWWPLFGHFDHLHAEYEVGNARGGYYYLDFAYIRAPYKLVWEVDDFSSHGKSVTRRTFDYERDRQNNLVWDGWQVYRFSLDAIRERPMKCRQFVLQVIGKLYGGGWMHDLGLSLKQREIMRFALSAQKPFVPEEICKLLRVKGQHARDLLFSLVEMELLAKASGETRIRSYKLGPRAKL
ncbi:DNA-binding response regulator [Paenibacillus koleovorans]|uniref:DNA-binding response regulator n=1 Tax=Paenibacillus koleovorans TaxID=121608 RepID=UPI000FD8844E|nr:DNA-binding response regulator [Paenibacillus koleovorans]